MIPVDLHGRWPLVASTRNLVRFSRHLPEETMDASFAGAFAFRDAGSRFMFLKSTGTGAGPDTCWGVYALDARPLFDKLLGLSVAFPEMDPAQHARLLAYNSMNYYRSHVDEFVCWNGTDPAPPVRVRCLAWFAAADVLRIRYELRNAARGPVRARLAWRSEGAATPGSGFAPGDGGLVFTNRHKIQDLAYRARALLEPGPGVPALVPGGNRAASAPQAVTLEGGGARTFDFLVRFAFEDEAWPDAPAGGAADEGLPAVLDRHEALYAGLPPMKGEAARHRDLARKAAGTLSSLRYRDRTCAGGPAMTLHAGKTGVCATWFWDTALALVGLGLTGDRETARGAARVLTGGIAEDGTPPCTYQAGSYRPGYQMPILAWGLVRYLALQPDRELMERAYAPLSRYADKWLGFRGGHGLIVPPRGHCYGLDDALRWSPGLADAYGPQAPWAERPAGPMRPDEHAAPDINAFVALELLALAAMADALGLGADAARRRAEARRLRGAINRRLWNAEAGAYQDLHLPSGRFNGVTSLGSFIPVYAGFAPRRRAAETCDRYLLSPEHFLTPLPFPVIDLAHPTFRHGGLLYAPPEHPGALVQQAYWRGRTWLHGDVWFLGALCRAGRRREADRLADRILEAAGRTESICECNDSLTGYPNGHNEFAWSSAALLALASGLYRKPAVPRLAPRAADTHEETRA